MAGSGMFSTRKAVRPHVLQGGGLGAEMEDLRLDCLNEFRPLAALTVEEFTNLAATNTAGLLAATATTVAVQTITSFLTGAAGTGALSAYPRSIKFTTAGSTASDAPATCVVTGKDVNGSTQTETVTLAQTATTAETTKCFSSLTSVVYAAGDGTGATIAIGIGTKTGFAKKLKARAGSNGLVREIIGGAVVQPSNIGVDEWTDPAAVLTTALLAATATTVAAQTVLAAALTAGGVAAILLYPRNITFTTGGTATDAPASVVITGTDINNAALTETLVLSQSAGTDQGVKAFKTIVSIVYGAGVGTGGTVAIGIGKKFGLSKPVKYRAGVLKPIQEIAIGAVVTTGTFTSAATSPPNGTYSPSANPNGSTDDFGIYYEVGGGGTVVSAATSAPNGSYTPSLAPDGAFDYTIYYEYDPTV